MKRSIITSLISRLTSSPGVARSTSAASQHRASQQGITLVELIITLAVAAIFLASIFTLVSNVILFATTTSQRTTASNLAYANLRQFADSTEPTWFTCPATPTDPVEVLSKTGSVPKLPGTVTETVIASAPYGCGGGMPVKVVSSVTYGGRTVVHATYAGF